MKKILTLFFAVLVLASSAYAGEMYNGNDYENSASSADPQVQMYAFKVGFSVIQNFKLPDVQEELNVKILFKVSPEGDLTSYKIIQPSGNSVYDNNAVQAVKNGAPYPKPIYPEISTEGMILTLNSTLIKLVQQLDLSSFEAFGDVGGGGMVEAPKVQKKKFITPGEF